MHWEDDIYAKQKDEVAPVSGGGLEHRVKGVTSESVPSDPT